jgi:hypothetical protein
MSPPRSAERVRQLIRLKAIPYTPAADVLTDVATKYKYLIKRSDFEAFMRIDRPPHRPKRADKEAGEKEDAA